MEAAARTGTQTRGTLLRLARPELLEIPGYEPVEPLEETTARYRLDPSQIAKLDGNENPYGPCAAAIEALRGVQAELYPDPEQRPLRSALAEYTGAPANDIVAGHGSDELIDLIGRALLAPGDNIVDCPPTFGMYKFTAAVCGAEVRAVPRLHDFRLDVGAMRRAVDSRTKLIFLPSPNNPTGNLLPASELEGCLELGPAVVVDEAYIEFAGLDRSYTGWVSERQNLIVLRTFSKWAALAGLRLGYGIMPRELADLLRLIKPPYTPNAAAEAAGLASLRERRLLMEHVRAIVEERDWLAGQLRGTGYLEPFVSDGNFLLCRVHGGEAPVLAERLKRLGVFVRHFDQAAVRDCVRISVGRRRESELLLAALEAVELSGKGGGQ